MQVKLPHGHRHIPYFTRCVMLTDFHNSLQKVIFVILLIIY